MIQFTNKIEVLKYIYGVNCIYLKGFEKYLKVLYYLLIGCQLSKNLDK